MKSAINIISIVALAVSLMATSSYGMDRKSKEIVLAKLMIEDSNTSRKRAVSDEKVDERPALLPQSLVYKGSAVFLNDKTTIDKTPAAFRSSALDFEFPEVLGGVTEGNAVHVGLAFATHVFLHEMGHDAVADYVGARGRSLKFLTTNDGQFFLASSTVREIDDNARLPYHMGGEFAADLTFEYALQSYRREPTLYNRSLMFFSGTDLLFYSLYAFYMSDGHGNLDPVAISENSGISEEAIISVAIAKTMINAYRIYSGNDTVVPYFTVDEDSAILNLRVLF